MSSDQNKTTTDGMESHLIAEDAAVYALKLIARGRRDNGRPVSAETARTVAREALTALQEAW